MGKRKWFWLLFLILTCGCAGQAQEPRRARLCVLDFGPETLGRKTAATLAQAVPGTDFLTVADVDESRVAARGQGYTGSLNLSLEEARDLGGALGCGFYVLGKAVTKQRSTIARPLYYESYAAIMLVDAGAGRLLVSDFASVTGSSLQEAERLLPEAVATPERVKLYLAQCLESSRTASTASRDAPPIEDVPEDNTPAAQGLRLPAPYRRLTPPYPETAARAEVTGTVDVLVSLDTQGAVTNVEVVRWAGFGLDEATVATVRTMNFRPALRDGVAIPLRVLLRYNFRPKTQGK